MTCGLHRKVASELVRMGGLLRCTVCLKEQPLVEETIAHHLAWGWPEHCGRVMRWVTDREILQERRTLVKT